ncbi:MAG: hypothetical protein SFV24_21115 [Gemmatimonadales bacterium]|nr:hypothetical protein [Gemmatimonadales bacterium]
MSAQTPTARTLAEWMAAAPRGPRRDGIFALWLTVRVIEDLANQGPTVERAFRRRVGLLDQRLSSLALPIPLRRGLTGVLTRLKEAGRGDAGSLLQLLGAAAREAIGPEAVDLFQRAARALR